MRPSSGATASGRAGDAVPAPPDMVPGRWSAHLRDLHPGYFALVMATGIVSVSMGRLGLHRLSAVLLVIAAVCWLVLAVGHLWRAIAARSAFLADLHAPARAFSFFTVVAASDVLATRLAGDGHRLLALPLAVLAAVAWLALSYAVPLRVITGHRTEGVLAAANGTWLVWIVATQSLSIVVSVLTPLWPGHRPDVVLVAVAGWGVGLVLYLVLMTVVLLRLLLYPVHATDLTPPYWISMGATAITVLAGVRLLALPRAPLLEAMAPVLTGLSVVLWAFGTWLWPPLVVWTLRRTVLRGHYRPGYQPPVWSIVFPLGMYAVSSMELGTAVGSPWIHAIGRAEAWFGLLAWTVAFVAMLATIGRHVLPVHRAPTAPLHADEGNCS